MSCNCKRVKNFDELRQELDKNVKVIRVSRWMKCAIFLKYLLFTFKNVMAFGYNLFRYDDLKEWTGI